MDKEILKKALEIIPVEVKGFPKEGGTHHLIEYSWVKNSWWTGGWCKEGQVLLNESGFPTGEVIHINCPGIGGTWRWREYYSGGEARYLLSYHIEGSNNKTVEEQVTIYKIK